MKFYWEQGKLDKKWIDNFCKGNWPACIRYQKEENGIPHPDNMLPDGRWIMSFRLITISPKSRAIPP